MPLWQKLIESDYVRDIVRASGKDVYDPSEK